MYRENFSLALYFRDFRNTQTSGVSVLFKTCLAMVVTHKLRLGRLLGLGARGKRTGQIAKVRRSLECVSWSWVSKYILVYMNILMMRVVMKWTSMGVLYTTMNYLNVQHKWRRVMVEKNDKNKQWLNVPDGILLPRFISSCDQHSRFMATMGNTALTQRFPVIAARTYTNTGLFKNVHLDNAPPIYDFF